MNFNSGDKVKYKKGKAHYIVLHQPTDTATTILHLKSAMAYTTLTRNLEYVEKPKPKLIRKLEWV